MIPEIDRKYFLFSLPTEDIKRETPNDITVRCPICGDSERDSKKARGHLYLKRGMDVPVYHCFNCEFSGNMYSYLKEVNSVLFEQYKREKREESFEKIKSKNTEFEPTQFTYKKKRQVESFILPEEFIPAGEIEQAVNYLENRNLSPDDIFFSPDNIQLGDKYLPIKGSIVIPLWYKREERLVYGFQARSIEGKTFYSYIPDENSGYKVWNLFEVDKTKTVFIFESTFDALSSGLPRDRIVAALGADLNEDRINEFKDVIFCFDNQFQDLTSKQKSIKLLQQGYKVFVWDPKIKEKDANEWSVNHPEQNFARIILKNIYSGTKGVLKLKLSV